MNYEIECLVSRLDINDFKIYGIVVFFFYSLKLSMNQLWRSMCQQTIYNDSIYEYIMMANDFQLCFVRSNYTCILTNR